MSAAPARGVGYARPDPPRGAAGARRARASRGGRARAPRRRRRPGRGAGSGRGASRPGRSGAGWPGMGGPEAEPRSRRPARLCLRSGLLCFGQVSRSMGLEVPAEPHPDAGIDLPYDDYLDAIARLREMDFPMSKPADSWPDFVGWRVNYEQAGLAIAEAIDAVPALSSGPRRHRATPMPPLRPLPGRPPSGGHRECPCLDNRSGTGHDIPAQSGPLRRPLLTATYQSDIILIGDRNGRTPRATGGIPCTH